MTKGTTHKKYIACPSLVWEERFGVKSAWLLLVVMALSFLASCEEVQEASEYDNWQVRNEAYIDSLKQETGEIYVATEEQAQLVEPGQLFAIRDVYASTNEKSQYIYCKKIVSNPNGERPFYTSTVLAYYYATLINGNKVIGNFIGYSAIDQHELNNIDKQPTDFDSIEELAVSGNLDPTLSTGWTTAVQYMRAGERWMIYMPYKCALGVSNILEYSTLAFDVILVSVNN